ncbi:MAG: MFS transporter, partial [Streptosporangiaceae bacterium]
LTVLVWDRTHSPLWTAVTYAGSYLPWLLGGVVLAGLADTWSRRRVLISCDVTRGSLIALIAVPGIPLQLMVALLFTATLLDGPFMAARAATFADILPGDRYRLGVATASSTFMAAMVAGFVAGGILVGTAGARPALLIDAATFAASALLIQLAVSARPPAAGRAIPAAARISSGLVLVFSDRRLRTCMLFGWLEALWSVPAGLAVPYAAALGGGPAAAGLLFAAAPLGTAAGTAVYGRRAGAQHQARWMGPLAVLCCAVLAIFAARPGLAWSLVIITVSGVLGCYQIAANVGFMTALRRRDQQAQAFGVATAGIWTAQGLAYLAAGALADVVAPARVIAICGVTGAAAAAALTISGRRAASGAARQPIPAASAARHPDPSPSSRPLGGDLVKIVVTAILLPTARIPAWTHKLPR